MPAVSSKPQLVTASATLINTGEELIVSVNIANLGSETAQHIYVTGATLGQALRLSPQQLPVFVGDLPNEGSASVGARFSVAALTANQKYLLTIRGTYGSGPTAGFVVNRYVMVPTPTPYAIPRLRAHVTVALSNATWAYTVFNDEPLGSPLYIAAFHLDLAAPTTVTGNPVGWRSESDSMTYAGWISDDDAAPFLTHVAPQRSLTNFEIQSPTTRSESTSFSLISWDHARDQAGPVALDTVLSPSGAR